MDNEPSPFEGFETMLTAATALHEMYLTYVTAGFSEDQAFELIRAIVVTGIKGGSS